MTYENGDVSDETTKNCDIDEIVTNYVVEFNETKQESND
eukprot:CAMPEP_0196764944 /NCGR_PEP_ID=MMETSP1095-20130614/7228_1 /TAXON_ID=96789 ORGANISM="Chromulina nebulosa, Strain UTEXLB2642" /NCGR_SAMPLE_ID=MMETSP1095 /ASSEMBLY_ACC=CAM_ASM_000446 /LENGTH=38 /DNA_ID= /DNA_START= /DNA_END= /DNA_ORIENTATION=